MHFLYYHIVKERCGTGEVQGVQVCGTGEVGINTRVQVCEGRENKLLLWRDRERDEMEGRGGRRRGGDEGRDKAGKGKGRGEGRQEKSYKTKIGRGEEEERGKRVIEKKEWKDKNVRK